MDFPHLIVLSGIDGSGKSSHLAWIAAALRAAGQRYHSVRLRWAALTSYPLLLGARLLGYAPRRYNPRSQTVVIEHRYDRFLPMRLLWPQLFALDMQVLARRKVLRPLHQGEWVLCDRYVLDAIVDVATMLRNDHLLENRFARQLLPLIPADSRSLILDTDPATAYERKLDVPNREFLTERRPRYLQLAATTHTPVVDGNRAYAAVQADIAAIVGLEPLAAHRGVLIEGLA
jgi:thymidylate kinase